MKLLKYLTLGVIFSILPSCVSHSASEITWSKADSVATFYICRTEEDIMQVALADATSDPELREIVLRKRVDNSCLSFHPPLSFIVKEVIGSYLDFNNTETSILYVGDPSIETVSGYVVAAGRPTSYRENSH
jgi:hypothetical protein|tara:strand:- start:398 stop:793 length:396 start_codon:yes stop_codon:yes gene_type:complete